MVEVEDAETEQHGLMAHVYFVEKRLPSPDRFSRFARLMFHGYAERRGAAYPLLHYQLGDELRHRLLVSRNFYRRSEAFQPNLNLLVSEELRSTLAPLGAGRFAFLAVEFSKVFSEPYRLDEERYSHDTSDEQIMARFPHDGALAAEVGTWFELIVPMHERALEGFEGPTKEHTIVTEMSSKPLVIELSAELLEANPILYKRGLVLSELAFSALRTHLDEAFFSSSRIELTPSRSTAG